jgi:hypothetical protein
LGPAAVGRVVVDNGLAAGDEIALRDPTVVVGDDETPANPGGTPAALPGGR